MQDQAIMLGRRIKARRALLALEQADVARRADITIDVMSRLERGLVKRIPPQTLARIAQILETSIDYLVGLEAHEEKPAPESLPV